MCVQLGAVCARARTVCAARALLNIFCLQLQRDTDVVFLCRANSRLLLLARRCRGSSDEPGRRGCVEPNVDWSRLLGVVLLQDTEIRLQQH